MPLLTIISNKKFSSIEKQEIIKVTTDSVIEKWNVLPDKIQVHISIVGDNEISRGGVSPANSKFGILSRRISVTTDDYYSSPNKYSITRGEMDKYAVESHQKATYTTEYGGFKKEIVDIIVDNRKGRNLIVTDENIRSDTSIEKLAKLKSAFKESGVVTAGNSSSINDGASILMLVSEKILYDYKLTPLAEWIDSSLVGLEPRLMGMGPEIAVKKLLTQQKMDITDIDIFELNEAFAAQSIACIRQLGINDMDKVNPKGGAIALGHPVGASGSRILTTLIYELIENKGNYGIASLCIGGGMGAATLIKNANSNL